MRFFAFLLVLCALASCTYSMHVLVVSIPAYGHFMPVKAIAEELLLRGHRLTIFIEDVRWCETPVATVGQFNCVAVPPSGTFERAFFVNMSKALNCGDSFNDLFKEMFRHHSTQLPVYLEAAQRIHRDDPFHVVLMDLSTILGLGLSAALNIPHVSVFPLSMQMSIGTSAALPALGTELPGDGSMNLYQRAKNHLTKVLVGAISPLILKELNDAREESRVRPLNNALELAGLNGLIFAPTVWGYDIPQPLCPNIIALGAFSPYVSEEGMEPELLAFLTTCAETGRPVGYVNFGTLSVVSEFTFVHVYVALVQAVTRGMCIVWKIPEHQRRDDVEVMLNNPQNLRKYFFLSARFRTPVKIMKHPATRVFLSHCGDTSVLEAIQAELPIAGIPFFADQGDVCLRVQEAGIGVYLGNKMMLNRTFVTETLLTLADEVSSRSFREKLRLVRKMSDALGGAKRAAEIIEDRYNNGLLGPEFFPEGCFIRHSSTYIAQGLDLWALKVVLAVLSWHMAEKLLLKVMSVIRRLCSTGRAQ
jgi:UDP:flavonoid glycosyltransferase YjiC (YdhE family)